jgi:SAM-dependent methyltransferase
MVEYDAFAEIYDVWVGRATVAERNLPFYVEEYLGTEGPVAELGVGTGRIAIEAAKQGRAVVGVDSSVEMLARCRERAEAAGVSSRLPLLQADMRDFTLPEPAALVTIPFHSIGHLVTPEAKRAALRRIHAQLRPGGRLIFDHFVFDPEAARRNQAPVLQAEYVDDATGRETLLWSYARYDHAAQTLRLITWTEELDETGVVVRRKYRRLSLSWLGPDQTRALLAETGFTVEALYGDFNRCPFTPDSPRQVWIARRD